MMPALRRFTEVDGLISMPRSATYPLTLADRCGGEFTARCYVPEDRAELEAMYEDFEPKRRAQGLPPEGADQLRRWLDRVLAQGVHLVVTVEGRIQGHVMLIPLDSEVVELANFLHQSIRGRGIGTIMNRLIVEEARAQGYRRVWLSVEPSNRAALRSYRSAGFQLLPGSMWAQEVEMALDLTPETTVSDDETRP